MDIETISSERGKYVFLFSDCVPVKGHAASAIYDLTRGRISTFPSEYYALLESFREHRLGELLDALSADDRPSFLEFLEFLFDNEYACMRNDPGAFPAIPSGWDAPCVIQNAIIDVDARHHDYGKLVAELDALGCQHLQLRSYSLLFGVAELVALARLCHGTSIQTLQAILMHDPARSDDDYAAVVTANPIVYSLILHSANDDRKLVVDRGARGSSAVLSAVEISFSPKKLESHQDCGTITVGALLAPSTPTFTELHHFNGCLNRKVSVDASGQVRNCPAMAKSFGHHGEVALAEVVAQAGFQKAWRARKDEIQVCRDCPYRYACTDCRAFLEDPDAEDSKPLKCGYDPYTDSWTDWRARPQAMATMEEYRKRRHLPVLTQQTLGHGER
jgi:SPASM domain peptide maturase of grasp-with-spasm system